MEVYFLRLPWSLESFFLDCDQLKCSALTQAPLQPAAHANTLHFHRPIHSQILTQLHGILPMETILGTPVCAEGSLTSLTPEKGHYPVYMS